MVAPDIGMYCTISASVCIQILPERGEVARVRPAGYDRTGTMILFLTSNVCHLASFFDMFVEPCKNGGLKTGT